MEKILCRQSFGIMSPTFLGSLQLRKIKGSFFWRFSFFAKVVLFAGALRELANGL